MVLFPLGRILYDQKRIEQSYRKNPNFYSVRSKNNAIGQCAGLAAQPVINTSYLIDLPII
tara:strand:+ start:486 stop:665 length:180 start_codon:yes stop_codon:yes gene_type:complete